MSGRRRGDGQRPATGDELAGLRYRFRLDEHLGDGSYGSVWLAECLTPEASGAPVEPVAIKLFARPRRRDPLDSLQRELSALLAIDSDRLPRVWDWALVGERSFVAMRFFAAGSLDDGLERPLDDAVGRRLLGDLLNALHAAEQAAIMHLDIKPSNVLLDGDGGFVLCDFGLSQALHTQSRALAGGVGSRAYRAPEQEFVSPELYGPRIDLWGVGATVWAARAGVDLAARPDLLCAPGHCGGHGLPPLSDLRPDVAPDLERAVMSLVAYDPDDRPGSAAEVLAEWHRGATEASPPGVVDRGELEALISGLVDQVLIAALRAERGLEKRIERLADGDVLAAEGDTAHHAFLLLRGALRIEKGGRRIHTETREGIFVGEVAALTGEPRTAAMIAEGDVAVVRFNAAELGDFLYNHPPLAMRLVHSLAARLARSG